VRVKRRPQQAFLRPQFETLEDRSCPSGVTVSIAPPVNGPFVEGPLGIQLTSFTVSREGGLGGHTVNVSYEVGVAGDTATNGKDFRMASRGVLKFGTDETSESIPIRFLDDFIDEDDTETVSVRLTKVVVSKGPNGQPPGTIGNAVASIAIVDNEPTPFASVEGPAEFNENNGTKTYKVSLSDGSSKVIVVGYAVTAASDTMNIGTDIQVVNLPTTGQLTFQPGERSKTIKVKIIEDKIVEPKEGFRIELTPIQNLRGAGNLLVQINDDDKALVHIQAAASGGSRAEVQEGNQGAVTNVPFRVRLASDIERSISVLVIANGLRLGSNTDIQDDFEELDTTAFFPAGSRGASGIVDQFFAVSVFGDDKKEKTEKFRIFIDNEGASKDVKFGRAEITVSIIDDD
jgi:hypothetical protein